MFELSKIRGHEHIPFQSSHDDLVDDHGNRRSRVRLTLQKLSGEHDVLNHWSDQAQPNSSESDLPPGATVESFGRTTSHRSSDPLRAD